MAGHLAWLVVLFLYVKIDFQETIEACEMKVGTYSQINEYMMIYDNPRSRAFTDLVKGDSYSTFQTSFPQKTPGCLKPNFI